jgi:hypothetical protein
MPTDVILTTAATIGAQTIVGVIGLWLRLRWRTRQEQLHSRMLVELAAALRGGAEVEEPRHNGSRMTLIVSARQKRDERG